MPTAEIEFGAWMPDQPTYKNPGCVEALNVVPSPGGYDPLRGYLGSGDTISQECNGARQFFRSGGASAVVGGGSTMLFVRDSGGVTETTGYNAAADPWSFARFNNIVFAASESNDLQVLNDVNTDTSWVAGPASAPRAKIVERVANFLMLGAVNGIENRIQWSANNNPLGDWTPDRLTRAGYADLPRSYGAVQAIVGGRYPLVFQERGVHGLQYIGPPTTWSVREIEQDRGCIAPGSVVTIGFRTFFLAQDGFWMTNGSDFEPIGTQQINDFFFSDIAPNEVQRTHGVVDWQRESVIWAYKSGNVGFDRLLIYSWAQNRWSRAEISIERLIQGREDGTSLEDLALLYPNLETIPVSLDDPRWTGSNEVLSAFLSREYGTLQGSTLEATIVSGANQIAPGKRAFISEIWPKLEASNVATECAAYATGNTGSIRATSWSPVGVAGFSPVRIDGREIQAGIRVPAGAEWKNARGAQVTFTPTGAR